MGKPQTFRSPTAVVVWVVCLLFAVGNWIDLAVQGRDHVSAVAAALLLLVTGVAYATAQRPRLIVDDAGLTIRNPLRDYRIGYHRRLDALPSEQDDGTRVDQLLPLVFLTTNDDRKGTP